MGLNETEAIVLRTYNLAEADKIVVCLTKDFGVLRMVARGARRLKSRFGAGLEPFTIISLSFYEKEGRELVSLRSAEIQHSSFGLAKSADVVAALAYMSELVIEFAPPHEPNEKIFRMLRAVLLSMVSMPEDLSMLIHYFEVWLLKLSGFFPDLRSCAGCGRRFGNTVTGFFDAEFRLHCSDCTNHLQEGLAFLPGAQDFLLSVNRLSPTDFLRSGHSLSPKQRAQIEKLSQSLIRRALERQPRRPASFN